MRPRWRGTAETAARFVRVFSLGATVLYPLAGVATGTRTGWAGVRWALAAGLLAHVFSHVANDVADLPLDGTDPRRAPDPLVRGAIGPERALLLAVATTPLLFATLLGGRAGATGWLVAAVVLVGAYDLAGKSVRVPFAADLVQGAGCAALVVAGARAAGGTSAATWWAAGFAMAYDAMVNGVHGGVRDAANDAARGVATTASLLGARVVGGAVVLPVPMLAYAAALHVATGAALAGFLVSSPRAPWPAIVTIGLYAAATAMLARARGALRAVMAAGTWHLFLLPAALVAALSARMPAPVWAVTAAAFLVPPVLFGLAVHGTPFGVPSTTATAPAVTRATRRRRVAAVVEMVRPGTPAVAAALVGAGVVLADVPTWDAVPAMVATALIVAAANVFNDRCDLAADEVNRPDRPLPSAVVTPNDCDRLVLAATLGVLVSAATIGLAALVVATALLTVALSYSLVLRRVVVVNHLAVGLLFAAPVVYGGWVASGTTVAEHWAAAVLVTLFVFARETLKAVPDRRGDHAAGRRTVATVFGERAALRVFRVAAAAFCVAACAVYAFVGDEAYLVAVVALAVVPTLLTVRRVRGTPTADVVTAAVAFSGQVFALGMVPVLLLGRLA